MRKWRLLKNNQGNFLLSIVTLIGLMMAIVIASIVFFSFADAGQSVSNQTENFTITDVADDEHYNVSITPDTGTPAWIIIANNNATALVAGQYSTSGTHVTVNADVWGAGNTTATISYNARSYSSVGQVITYAIIVFVMLAIVPLIVVGGLMLNSLGFFSGGSGKP